MSLPNKAESFKESEEVRDFPAALEKQAALSCTTKRKWIQPITTWTRKKTQSLDDTSALANTLICSLWDPKQRAQLKLCPDSWSMEIVR